MSDPARDPHSFEAGARNQLALSKAEIVVENGGYDGFVDRILAIGDNSSAQVINAVEVSGKTAPVGGELNEHVWYDLPTMGKLADAIAAALTKADPDSAATFMRYAEGFKAKLKPLEAKEAQIKKDHAGEAVAVTEPVPLYPIEASGLKNATPEEFSERSPNGPVGRACVISVLVEGPGLPGQVEALVRVVEPGVGQRDGHRHRRQGHRVVPDRDPAPVVVLVEFDEQPRGACAFTPCDVMPGVEHVQGPLPLPQVLSEEPGPEAAPHERCVDVELRDQGIGLIGTPACLLARDAEDDAVALALQMDQVDRLLRHEGTSQLAHVGPP
ncbi:putative ABC-type metal ion transporter, periplasmic subunit (Precursor) [Streptomyces viridochromogenes Tue57]|uniref:Putative ABC-type metal ion transporter, periplasmic subunit (Precursor) n=1 Tax=Streptomyces viridochromogenes Tue57 TaxID=1160705 RepID=L8P2M9_STRVR|nr:putative ABC-type metal ion transporter, periplasmic subunit (Precursor) [Streptomyces viridochromogenes Tue57]